MTNILITGINGFIGASLAKYLSEISSDNQIFGITRSTKAESTFNALQLYDNPSISLIHGDVYVYTVMEELLFQYNIDQIYHLAAKVIVKDAAKSPLTTYMININGTLNILEAIRLIKGMHNKDIPTLVMSSDKAYGISNDLPYKETHPLNGNDIYSSSKAIQDILSRAYANNFDLPIVVARPCFINGTKILMGDGVTEKNIEDIKIGDEVLTHKNRAKKVINISKRVYSGNIITLKSEGLEPVTCTEEHPFYALKSDDMTCEKRDGKRLCHLGNELIRYCHVYDSNFELDRNQISLLSYIENVDDVSKNILNNFPGCRKSINPQWIKARDLNNRDLTSYLIPQIKTRDIEKIDILNYINKDHISGSNYDEQFIWYGKYKPSRGIPRYINLDNDFMTLLGYFVAEGSYTKYGNRDKRIYNGTSGRLLTDDYTGEYTGLSFKFNINENYYIQTVENLIAKIFGIMPYITPDEEHNSCAIRVTDKIIANLFLTLCGEYSHEKKLHKDLMLLPNEKLKHLIESLMNGDCWEDDGNRKGLTLQSDELNRQLWNISNRLKMLPQVYIYDQSKSGYSDKGNKMRLAFSMEQKRYVRYLKDNTIYSKIRYIKIESSSEVDVYNIEVEEDGSYCANKYIVHNCNTYGPYDFNWSRIIPSLAKSCFDSSEKDIPLKLNENSYYNIREYMFVSDTVNALTSLLNNIDKTKGEAFNISPNEKRTTEEVVNKFFELSEINKEIEFKEKESIFKEIPEQYLDTTKIQNATGWKPKTSFEEGLKSTIEGYKDWFDNIN